MNSHRTVTELDRRDAYLHELRGTIFPEGKAAPVDKMRPCYYPLL
jgi:hypothetical protein